MRMIRLLVVLVALLVPAVAGAQQIDGYRLNIYNAGAAPGATPVQHFDFMVGAIACNLPPIGPVNGVPVNPTRAVWDDPANAGRACQWSDPGTGPLFSVPFGSSYEAALQAFNDAGRGPESNRAPFSRLAAPLNALTGFRLIRP